MYQRYTTRSTHHGTGHVCATSMIPSMIHVYNNRIVYTTDSLAMPMEWSMVRPMNGSGMATGMYH